MENVYKNRRVSILFAFFFFLAIYGFFRSYFGLFPDFPESISALTHLHGILIAVWMLILIIQPLLIRHKQHQLHRFIGKLSYAYVPLLGIIMILTIRQGYLKGVGKMPQADLLAFQFVPISAFFAFIWSYVMAMRNRTHRQTHKSYMIVHALVLLWAAFGRLDYSWTGAATFEQSIAVSYLPSALLLMLIFLYEWLRQKNMNHVYLIAFAVFLATPCFYYFATTRELWQAVASAIFE